MQTPIACWACDSTGLTPYKKSNAHAKLSPKDFAITSLDYGSTLDLGKCLKCGFIQAIDDQDMTRFYQAMEDPDYEATGRARALQANVLAGKLLQFAKTNQHSTVRCLDVGAGSGLMVEAITNFGVDALGIEPSQWLVARAHEKGLKVLEGVLPHPHVGTNFDLVTLVDVIEHVQRPGQLIDEISKVMNFGGLLMVVTPNIGSYTAKVLGRHWWHFRIAHIGYFTPANLDKLLQQKGFVRLYQFSPTWYFPLDYIAERVAEYLPFLKLAPWRHLGLHKIQIPVNFFDSVAVVYQHQKQ